MSTITPKEHPKPNTVNQGFVEKYAKRIMAFSYAKVQDSFLAEDLSQEILLQLTIALQRSSSIDNMDAYVLTICKYTWSNFLKKNKKHWDYADLNAACNISDNTDVAAEGEKNILLSQMQKEISFLCSTHRKILKGFYFDCKTTLQISTELQIKESTIRWHLAETRKELQKAMEHSEITLKYEPVRMTQGYDGDLKSETFNHVFCSDLLVQNILYACYGPALSLSEIAKKLNVAAAYIEGKVEALANMDYLKEKKGKYQTNFYIKTPEHFLWEHEFALQHIKDYAEKLVLAVQKHMDDIMNIPFFGNNTLSRDAIAWMTYAFVANELSFELLNGRLASKKIEKPYRADGSRHWILMDICFYETVEDKALNDYMDCCTCYGYCHFDDGDFADMLTDENYLSILGNCAKKPVTKELLNSLTEIYHLLKEKRTPNEFQEIKISELVKAGYIKMVEHKPVLNILYLTAKEHKAYREQIQEIKEEVGEYLYEPYFDAYQKEMLKKIPSFLSEDARFYYSSKTTAGVKAVGYAIYQQLLKLPAEGDEITATTLVFEKDN